MKETQNELNYSRIAEAIRFIRDNRKEQPRLEAVAEAVNMSPFHFQRIFKEWAGITPKHFLQYLNVEYAKRILHETHASLFDTAQEVGLSGTGRLHDLFITVEGMTPGEYKNGGENLFINYSFAATPFGDILIASTPKGICSMEFADDRMETFGSLQRRFPRARFRQTLLQIFLYRFDDQLLHLLPDGQVLDVGARCAILPFRISCSLGYRNILRRTAGRPYRT